MRGPVDPDNLPEGTLVDCWRVVRPLGGGAYGTVYLVEKDGELYALKLARFLGNSGDERRTDERAQRELNCLLSLKHPHIVQVALLWPLAPRQDGLLLRGDGLRGGLHPGGVGGAHPPHGTRSTTAARSSSRSRGGTRPGRRR